jgi:hypothetical protein
VIVNLRLPWTPPALAAVPRLADFDAVVIATSAGKDSQGESFAYLDGRKVA